MITQMTKRLILVGRTLRSSVELQSPPLYQSISLLFHSSAKPKTSKSNLPEISLSQYLINNHKFSPEAALKASSIISHLKYPLQADSVISFFRQLGFSNTHLEKLVKRIPKILCANPEKVLKPKIKVFQEFGFSDPDIVDVISTDPWVLLRKADKLGPSVSVLKGIVGSNEGVLKVLKSSRWCFKFDLDKTLLPNIEFLKSIGVSSSQIVNYMFLFPRFFLLRHESIVDKVKRVDEMGFDRNSKMFLSAIRTMSSMSVENWQLKVKLFQSMGASKEDVSAMFRRAPQAFSVSEKKIKEVTELLVSSGKFDISFLVNFPELLVYSVEHRLTPRLHVLQKLEKKNVPLKSRGLYSIFKYTNQEFAEKYLIPYANELGDANAV